MQEDWYTGLQVRRRPHGRPNPSLDHFRARNIRHNSRMPSIVLILNEPLAPIIAPSDYLNFPLSPTSINRLESVEAFNVPAVVSLDNGRSHASSFDKRRKELCCLHNPLSFLPYGSFVPFRLVKYYHSGPIVIWRQSTSAIVYFVCRNLHPPMQ